MFLLDNAGEGTEDLVDGSRILEDGSDIRIENNDVAAQLVFGGVFSPDAFAEVVLGGHVIVMKPSFPFFHTSPFLAVSPASR